MSLVRKIFLGIVVLGAPVLGGHSASNAQPLVQMNETINKSLDRLRIIVNARGEGSLDHLIKSGTLGNKYQMKMQGLQMSLETLVKTFGATPKNDLILVQSVRQTAREIVTAKQKENPKLDGLGRVVSTVELTTRDIETELTLPKE